MIKNSESEKPSGNLSLIPFKELNEDYFIYGIYITFSDLNELKENDTAPCGNSCTYIKKGKYYFLTSDTVVFINDSTMFTEDCGMMPTEYHHQEKYTYHITVDKDSTIHLKIIK